MSETAGQDGAGGQANQNNEQAQKQTAVDGDIGTGGQGSESGAQGQGGADDQSEDQSDTAQDDPEPRQGVLLHAFHTLIRSALFNKIEEVAEHDYLKAEEAIAAVVEWIKEEAARLGWTVSDPAAHAIASATLLDYKLDAQDQKAVTPPPSEQEPAPPPDHPPPA